MSKKEELKEQVETEALMDAEVEAATDCGCCCSTKSKKEAKKKKRTAGNRSIDGRRSRSCN